MGEIPCRAWLKLAIPVDRGTYNNAKLHVVVFADILQHNLVPELSGASLEPLKHQGRNLPGFQGTRCKLAPTSGYIYKT